jgi:uncharacterized protein (DUF4213/DUF364 family)
LDNSNNLLESLIHSLPEGRITQVCIGIHWTAVVAKVAGEERCGLASTLGISHKHGEPDVPKSGQLESLTGGEIAVYALTGKSVLGSIGVAAINALLPRQPEKWVNINAEDVIIKEGKGKSVALIGHFPFIPRVRDQVGELIVLELNPQPGDMPAEAAEDILPNMDVVAISGTTLINNTLDGLLRLCAPQALIIILGPSTILSPEMFKYGIDLLCGAIVEDIPSVIKTVRQGGNFQQVHRAGVRLVSIKRSDF